MTINRGEFIKDTYYKSVVFNKAVLWKSREISLPPEIVKQFKPKGVTTVVFEDKKKGERWTALVETLREHFTVKQVGQEKQYYFPIEVFTKAKLQPADSPAEL